MKVLVVTQYFWPENFRINELVAGLIERGHSVTVLTGQPNYPQGDFFSGYGWRGPWTQNWNGAKIIRVPVIRRGNGGFGRLILNYLSFVFFGLLGVLFRLQGKFDVVIVFQPSPITVGIPAIIARRKFGAPIVFWVLDLWPESLSAAAGIRSFYILKPIEWMVRWIYSNCDRILVSSRAFVAEIVKQGADPLAISYFPNWVEQDYNHSFLGPPAILPVPQSGFVIMFAGNVGAAQDFPALLKAADALKEFKTIHWVIVGDGRMLEWVKNETFKRGLEEQIHFLGQKPSKEMMGFILAADAMLLCLKPELIFSLTVPGKLQSYMACGRPILAMIDGESARIVAESRSGLACDAGDFSGLAQNVLELMSKSPEELVRMGENGRAYALKHFNRESLFDQLEELTRKAIANRLEITSEMS